jgi:RecJ-like exonuclease
MKNKIILKVSLIVSLIGIFFIIFLANSLEPKIIKISDISEKNLDEYVKIQGQVRGITEISSENLESVVTLITITDEYESSMTIVLRKKSQIQKNQQLEVIGKVSEYENEIQIEASKIKILS